MLKFLVLCALAGLASATSTRNNPFGIVEGIKDCGSRGKLGVVTVTDCTTLPCHFIPHNTYDVVIRFISSTTSETLALFVFITKEGEPQELIFELEINGVIEEGVEYDLTFKLPVTEALAGTSFDIQFLIVERENIYHEVCAEASVTVGPA